MPPDETVAMESGEDDHVIEMPEIGVPLAAFGTAATGVRSPTLMVDALAVIAIDATAGFGATDVTTVLADCPSELAVMVTLPPISAARTPVELMLTMLWSDETKDTVRPVRTLPAASFSVTMACAVSPTLRDGGTLSVMVATDATVLTGAATTIDVLPDLPSDVAVIVTGPALSALTMPLAFTVATAGSEVVQTMARPVSTVP